MVYMVRKALNSTARVGWGGERKEEGGRENEIGGSKE